jgi:deazaflavin-dependent oxidoreductase (nitroreductase family)
VAGETKYVRPGIATRFFNRVVMLAEKAGISLAGSRTLIVPGRKSGEPRTTPVNPIEVDGVTYIVAPRGTTQWVRNLRAAGEGQLKLGRSTRRFGASELADSDKLAVLRPYLDKWAWEVGAFFDLPKDPSDEDIRGVAHLHPVFRVVFSDAD